MTRDATHKDSGEQFLRVRKAKAHADTQYLIEALRDPDNRSTAAGYLADLGALEAIPPLVRLLDAADPHVRAAAAEALGRLGGLEALPRLREIAGDDEDFVRSWAIGAIGRIGDPQDVDVLIPLLADSSMRVRAGRTAGTRQEIPEPRLPLRPRTHALVYIDQSSQVRRHSGSV